jgi:hypothetical protein
LALSAGIPFAPLVARRKWLAGHRDAQGAAQWRPASTGIPLGMFPGQSWQQQPFTCCRAIR